MYYRCVVFDKDGKTIEERHIEVAVGTVGDATNNSKVQALKRKAQLQGFGFRVTREE